MTKVSLIHRWLSSSSPEGDDESVFNNPLVHWCHNVCGPVGNSGDCHQKNQQSFNSVKWLESQGAVLGGFIIHTGEYVNCIQIIGNQEQSGMPFNIYLIILWSLIVWVGVVLNLNRTVVVDSDWHFDNLCGSHPQSQSELMVNTLVIDLISQLSRDVIGRLSVKPWCCWRWLL